MFTTIEADIDNGRITGAESGNLPKQAHVLITLIPHPVKQTADSGRNREPDPALRGSVTIRGNILDSAPCDAWDLPS